MSPSEDQQYVFSEMWQEVIQSSAPCLKDSDGRNILHHVAFRGCQQSLDMILNSSVNLVDLNYPDSYGMVPSDIASLKGHLDFAEQLLARLPLDGVKFENIATVLPSDKPLIFPGQCIIGHRGSGTSQTTEFNGLEEQLLLENTIPSFINAFNSGADFVEFDVQISLDNIPVIYHDFRLTSHEEEILEASISALSYDTLKKIGKDHISKLQEIFMFCPIELGFNVEIKYPDHTKLEEQSIAVLPREEYLDRILEVINELHNGRTMFFSSFDPEICSLLKSKQSNWPVFFLTHGGETKFNNPLMNSIAEAVTFCTQSRVDGIVCHAKALVLSPRLIREIKRHGVFLLSWGSENNQFENISLQLQQGVDGIILDRVKSMCSMLNKVRPVK